jgi:hypothetical protein
MSPKQLTDEQLDQHLRRCLHAVATSIEDAPAAATAGRSRRRGRRILFGIGAIAIAVPVAAGAIVRFGPEYVDQIPPDNVIVTDSLDGERYWMVEAFHPDQCGRTLGVELVVEDRNIIGREWSTTGYTYGEPAPLIKDGRDVGSCGTDTTDALANPALTYSSGTNVGDGMVWVYAVHPDVTALRLTLDHSRAQQVPVHPVHGAGYAVIELPEGTKTYTIELLANGEVVPGSTETKDVPDRP